MALETKHPLPLRGEYDAQRQVVFTRNVTPPNMPSIIVLPMLVHDKPLRTLVLGSGRPRAFGDVARNMLEVVQASTHEGHAPRCNTQAREVVARCLRARPDERINSKPWERATTTTM